MADVGQENPVRNRMMGEALRNSTNTVSRFQMRVDQVNVKKIQSTMKNTSSIIISVQSARWGRRKRAKIQR